jgi:hypothetical protein
MAGRDVVENINDTDIPPGKVVFLNSFYNVTFL